jgi:ankyrin repeat protein
MQERIGLWQVEEVSPFLLDEIARNSPSMTALTIEENIDAKAYQALASALKKNTNLLSIKIGQKKKLPESISHYLDRNIQIAQISALLMRELVESAPTTQNETARQTLEHANHIAEEVIAGRRIIPTMHLLSLIDQLDAAMHVDTPPSALALRELSISSEVSGELSKPDVLVSDHVIEKAVSAHEPWSFSDKILSVKDMILQLCGPEALMGRTPLHYLAHANLAPQMEILLSLGASPNVQDDDHMTPLHLAISAGALEAVQTLVKHGARLNVSSNLETAFELALMTNHTDIINFLRPLSSQKSLNPHKLLLERRLFHVLGGKKLRDTVKTQGRRINAEGGITDNEGYVTLVTYLQRFIVDPYSKPTDAEAEARLFNILRRLQQVKTDFNSFSSKTGTPPQQFFLAFFEDIARRANENSERIYQELHHAKPNERYIIELGYVAHAMGASISIDNDGNYSLTIADRGPFIGTKEINKKRQGVQTLSFDKAYLKDVIHLLQEVQNQDYMGARNILFDKIPILTHSTYVPNETMLQSPYKVGICYFANPKTILYDEFTREFGAKDGNKLYKAFTLYMRDQVVQDYEKLVGKKDPYAQAATIIVQAKKKKAELVSLLRTPSYSRLANLVLDNLENIKPFFPQYKTNVSLLKFLLEKLDDKQLELLLTHHEPIFNMLKEQKMPFDYLLRLDKGKVTAFFTHAFAIEQLIKHRKTPLKSLLDLNEKVVIDLFSNLGNVSFILDKTRMPLDKLIALPPSDISDLVIDPFSEKAKAVIASGEEKASSPTTHHH